MTNSPIPAATRTHPFGTDRPISTLEQDELGRELFARSLATMLAAWDGSDSIVIGLNGQWGAGKSSLVNMTIDALGTGPTAPDILLFNPWEWSRYDDIASAFFSEIEKLLRGPNAAAGDEERAKRWSKYTRVLEAAGDVSASIETTASTIGATAIAFGVGATVSDGAVWARYGGAAVAALGVVLTQAGKVTRLVAELLGRDTQPSLPDLKRELHNSLRERSRSILVIIDDIDRLTPEETTRVFQLVRANADFPRMVYLLPFSRLDVASNIHRSLGVDGDEYVEKMIQVPLDIPKANQEHLDLMFEHELARLLGQELPNSGIDLPRLRDLYVGGVQRYMETPRDLKRYFSSLNFVAGLHRTDADTFDVDVIDLIGVEVLRVFEPTMYDAIHAGASQFAQTGEPSGADSQRELQDSIDQALKSVSPERTAAARGLLRFLFPSTSRALGGIGTHVDPGVALRELRVCHEDNFQRYFQLNVASADASPADLRQLAELAGDAHKVSEHIAVLARRGILSSLLRRLRADPAVIPQGALSTFIAGLIDASEHLADQGEGALWVSDSLAATALIGELLQPLPMERRIEIVREAMAGSTGVHLAEYFVGLELHRRDRSDPQVLPEAELEALRQLVIPRLREFAASDSFASSRHIASLLYRVNEWVSPEASTEAAAKLAGTASGLASLVRSFRTVRSSNSRLPAFALDQIEEFISLNDADSMAERYLAQPELTDEQREVLAAFREAIRLDRAGRYDRFGIGRRRRANSERELTSDETDETDETE